jgi:alpha-glucosidase
MLSGPMDYTPGVLSLKGRGGRDLESTLARQLSLYMTLYSPIQMVADDPENLKQFPREMEFLRVVPADWAETHTLSGEVGDYVVVARKDRNSEDWYIGGTTNADERTVSVPLAFLGTGSYKAQIYRDGPAASGFGPDRHDIVIEEKTVTAADTLTLRMAPAGGFAVRLVPVKGKAKRK